ncbi:SDR family NAD(P)-dependent oxidoreductase [Pseudodesulfovibrio tunisiensis]|uniref:SDR family NAD(P)-dependent oxidoreductase n=1 Tax=Pseudodesulfovibrio tunisiensis TaxID=463192 RepID=UPI001FB38048|nr:SDR family NAD(P)-dependent oxidoreductase [Pseudodesulfovibrio tunisiensis]
MKMEFAVDLPNIIGTGEIAVTGASGFVGRHLCNRLIELGVKPKAIVRRDDEDLRSSGADICVVDFQDPKDLSKALGDASHVIHCAANAMFGNGPQYERDNVETTRTLLKALSRKTRHLVFLSTIGAIDRCATDDCSAPLQEESPACPTSDYGRSKLRCESMVKESGIPYTIIRPTMVVGSDMRADSHFSVFAGMALRKSFFARFCWPGAMSVIHVDDLVDAIIHSAIEEDTLGQTCFCAGEDMKIGEYLKRVNPKSASIGLQWATTVFGPLVKRLPFQLKALFLPALTASDDRLRATGWAPQKTAWEALQGVVERERLRKDPFLDPGGLTVVTGAASGLGRAFAEKLAPLRQSILLVDRDPAGLAEVTAAFPHCRTCTLDLTNEKELEHFLDDTLQHDAITELYACAGIGARGTVQQLDLGIQKKIFEINLLSRVAMGKACAKRMTRRHFGRIVFVSSSSAFQPLPYMAAYASSNSALLSLGEAWGAELRRSGVHMLTICPGGMKTNFQKSAGVKELEGEKLMLPEEVVRQTMNALKGQGLTAIVSVRSKAMALLARLLPREISVRLWMRLMGKMR